ncbi:hypothetical protein [Marinobacter salexigens]|uniref:hypothetical protein n=1 Tax=Marinobacter salexigens TaxID=1925763 RepID=UPI0020917501|nr:hypothetical protein [Marinobacter salexigens]
MCILAPGYAPEHFFYPGEKPYRMINMDDLFGNTVGIYSHSYGLVYSEGAY